MLLKLNDANESEKEAKFDMVQRKIELKKVVREYTLAGQEFNSLIDYEWNSKWKIKDKECKKKIKGLKQKHDEMYIELERKHLDKNKTQKSETEKKFQNTDEKLSMKSLDVIKEKVSFKDKEMKEVNKTNKVVNLGVDGINVNMEKILSKPPGHTVYRKVSTENMEIAVEESINKLKYKNLSPNTDTEN